jgi:hypothetical protein
MEMDRTNFSNEILKIAVIGAGRSRNGIGPFIAKFFKKNGAEVAAVLGPSRQSAEKASKKLAAFGISAREYIDFDDMIVCEKPDVIVIASPKQTHFYYLKKAIDASCHIFCEKPFIWETKQDFSILTRQLLEDADQRGLIIGMNSQLPFLIPAYESIYGKIFKKDLKTFHARMSPTLSGADMIPDSVPHPLSLLFSIAGDGVIQGIDIDDQQTSMMLRFKYTSAFSTCSTEIQLVQEDNQPKTFYFAFNGKKASRKVNLPTYAMTLTTENESIEIEDPLNLSVKDFITAVQNLRQPLIGPEHILKTSCLLHDIFSYYENAIHE